MRSKLSNVGQAEVGFGLHLIVDGYEANVQRLEDLGLIYSFLEDLPNQLRMQIISPPYLVRYNGDQVPDDWGISAFVLIAESHISIHTFPAKAYFNMDVFACKKFDTDLVRDIISRTFQTKTIDFYVFERGDDFPRNKLVKNRVVESPQNSLVGR